MEVDLNIQVDTKKIVVGSFLKSSNIGSNKIIIFIHGLASKKDDHIFFNGSKFFSKYGFSSYRYNQYGPQKNQRKMSLNVNVFSNDLEKIVEYFSKKEYRIFIVAHSLGCHIALPLLQDKRINSVVFWNPSLRPAVIFSNLQKFYGHPYIDVGYKIIFDTYEDEKTFSVNRLALSKLKIICSSDSLNSISDIYNINKPNVIKNCNHNFDNHLCERKLFNLTRKFLIT